MSSLNVLIMAAGLGTRMKSDKAKVLHKLEGLPLIGHALRAALELEPAQVITVVGHQAETVESTVIECARRFAARGLGSETKLSFALQAVQRGTGHAVMEARGLLEGITGTLVISYGDAPLIQGATLKSLLQRHQEGGFAATAMTAILPDPTGYGRILRDDQSRFIRVVEQRDASAAELLVTEINAGIYCFEIQPLLWGLDQLSDNNAQGEFYLTDVPGILAQAGHPVGLYINENFEEILGINNRIELADCGRRLRQRTLNELMLGGVTIVDPASTYISRDVRIGRDSVIHPQVIIEGNSSLGQNCEVHSWSHLTDVELGNSVVIKNSCVIEASHLQNNVTVGPFAHIRLNAEIGESAVIGNFVEVKKSIIGRGTKSMHLTYLGDATIGERTNIGAGTVTCNFDGKQKHQTIIGNDVKIGSDTMLVAPVKVGDGAVTGAGSVVTQDIPPHSLAYGVPARVRAGNSEPNSGK